MWAALLGIRELLGSSLGYRRASRVTKLHGGAVYYRHNHGIFFIHTKICICSLASIRLHLVASRLTGHCRNVGPKRDPCLTSSFWRLKFGGDLQIFGKIVDFCYKYGYLKCR